ncbi:MAG: gamma-glutamyl-gamma-aminobutyrate hydrolase family protein [Gemmatimonadaceae bacterium]|nr:gamma-glutamyl-gamma-aminobutyrate hydrolase family protein [Gemmatimonadaceae bacterium]
MDFPSKPNRPIIGIPTQTLQSLGGVSAEIPPSWVMSQRYILTLTAAGAIPWMIPLVDEETLRGIFDALDGVFLPGGADIDPASYGSGSKALCDKTDPERDRVEIALARWAIQDHKPVLGVCRGMQLINVAAGGTLYQDIAQQRTGSIKHDYFPFNGQSYARDHLAHTVEVSPSSRLATLFGAGELRVNSMHHQGVRELGTGLRETAVAPDGLIEGIEATDGGYVFAVQWHPETLTESNDQMRALFSDFISAAR